MQAPAADVPGNDEPELLLADCLEAPPAERPQRLELLCARHPRRSEELRRLFQALDGFGLVDEPETTVPAAPERLGPYRLLSLLGAGGMGTVHLALQEGVGRKVALKLLHRGPTASPHARERFRREVQALSRLDHPHICPVYDAGEIDGVPFLAMRYVAGQTWQAHIGSRRSPELGGTREELRVHVAIAEKVARALHVAHEQGLVHRDVKPGNVMIEAASGDPLLLDFGLARHDDGVPAALTQSNDRVGTPAYMAPEQVAGADADRRTDVYALGASLYEALTLHLPHEAPTREALYHAILAGDLVPARRRAAAVPRDLDVVLATALAKEPDRRYATAAAFADDLGRVLRQEPVAARPAGPWLRLRRFAQRNPFAATLTAMLLVATLALVLLTHARTRALATRDTALLAHAAQDTVEHDPVRAMRQALEGMAQESEEVRSALHAAVAASHERWRFEGRGPAHHVAFSRDDTKVLAAIGPTAHLLDRATGRELFAAPHADTVQGVAFSPSEPRFLTTGGNAAILWNLDGTSLPLEHPAPASGTAGIDQFMGMFEQPHPGSVLSGCFSPDGLLVATAASDWCVRVFDSRSGTLLGAPLRHGAVVGSLAWSAAHGRLATGEGWEVMPRKQAQYRVRIWDLQSGHGRQRQQFDLPERVQALEWSPDGRELAVACADGIARIYDWQTGVGRELAIGAWVWSVAWSPDGSHLAIASRDGCVRIVRRDGEVRGMQRRSEAHSACFSPDGQRLVVAFGDLSVRIFDLDLRELAVLRGHAGHVLKALPSADGMQVATASFDGTVRLWDLFDPELPLLVGHRDRVIGLAERPDGSLVSASEDGTLRIWDPRTGREMSPPIPLVDRPWAMALHEDGRHVLVAHWESTAAAHDLLAPQRPPVLFPQPGGFGMAAAWAADGRVWTAGRSTQAFAHEADGAARTPLPWPRGPGQQTVVMARAPDGRMAAGGMFGTITLLTTSGEVVRDWQAHVGWIHALAWSPDGAWLASAADDGMVRLWHADGGPGRAIAGHTARVMALAWSANGSWLASASSDGSARVWNPADATCFATLRRPGGSGALAVSWSRDGRFLWTAHEDGVIRAWPADREHLRSLAQRRADRLPSPRASAASARR